MLRELNVCICQDPLQQLLSCDLDGLVAQVTATMLDEYSKARG